MTLLNDRMDKIEKKVDVGMALLIYLSVSSGIKQGGDLVPLISAMFGG